MENKTFTLLVVSNRKGTTRSITLTQSWVRALAVLACLVGVLVGAAVVDYFGLLLQAGENKQLKAENATLRRQYEVVESKITTLENSLDRVKSFETKLKLITNIEDDSRTMKLAMGPVPKAGQSLEEMSQPWEKRVQREPTSEFVTKAEGDALLMEKSPLDEARGELSRMSQTEWASLSIRIDRAVKETELREKGILSLLGSLSERQSLLLATPSIKPVRGWFSSRFGFRIDPFTAKPVMHAGLDIAASPGTLVYAPADGVVSYVGYEQGYGKIVSIDHGFGVRTRYGHNSQVFVSLGQKVKRWDTISAVGSTGRSSGPHLHYEVRVHDIPVDPINYVLDE